MLLPVVIKIFSYFQHIKFVKGLASLADSGDFLNFFYGWRHLSSFMYIILYFLNYRTRWVVPCISFIFFSGAQTAWCPRVERISKRNEKCTELRDRTVLNNFKECVEQFDLMTLRRRWISKFALERFSRFAWHFENVWYLNSPRAVTRLSEIWAENSILMTSDYTY